MDLFTTSKRLSITNSESSLQDSLQLLLHLHSALCVGRRFVNAGAQAFVNLSNDAWSKSLACQYQHLSMAVFRSVENRVPTVRSTTTGQTCIIDPNGRILAMAEPFVETYLVGSIPVLDKTEKTVYTRLGDYVGVIFALVAILLLLAGLLARMLRKVRT